MSKACSRSGASQGRRRGSALIVVIAVLLLLSFLAVLFAQQCGIERHISGAYVDSARARILAQSGVESAVARVVHAARRGFPREPAGLRLAWEGTLPGAWNPDGDTYDVEVVDESAKLNVNMEGHPHLQTMLENLAEAAGLSRAVGRRLYRHRPYRFPWELRGRAQLSDREFEVMRDLVTVRSWSDPEVIQPVPLQKRVNPLLSPGTSLISWSEVRFRVARQEDTGRRRRPGRSPVNLNAASRLLLEALIRGLSGTYAIAPSGTDGLSSTYAFADLHYDVGGKNSAFGRLETVGPLDRRQAEAVAEAILRRRAIAPFRTWPEFDEFIRTEVSGRILDGAESDLLRANFDPNTRLNDFNPDRIRDSEVDKSDLSFWTCEFSFVPTGMFSLVSTGRVLDPAGLPLAQATIRTRIEAYRPLRESTRADFFGAGTSFVDLDPSGHPLLALHPDTGVEEETAGLSEMDGCLTLAPRPSESADTLGVSFRAGFEGSATAESATGAEFDPLEDPDPAPHDIPACAWKELGRRFPDGLYSEAGAVPWYDYRPEDVDGFMLCFWLKPNFRPEQAGHTRVLLTWQEQEPPDPKLEEPKSSSPGEGAPNLPVLPLGIYAPATANGDAASADGYEYGEIWDSACLLAAGISGSVWSGQATPCLNHREHGHRDVLRMGESWPTLFEKGRWIHIGWIHAAGHDTLLINGRTLPNSLRVDGKDSGAPPLIPAGLRLGELSSAGRLNAGADATLDEVLIWETWPRGDNPDSQDPLGAQFRRGRYPAVDDAVFTSAPVDAEDPRSAKHVRILAAQWTWYKPSSIPDASVWLEIVEAGRYPVGTVRAALTRSEGEGIDRMMPSPFRYRVHFRSPTGKGEPLLESPVFDDVTFYMSTGCRFLDWTWE